MRTDQRTWINGAWQGAAPTLGAEAQLVFVFGGRDVLAEGAWMADVAQSYPNGVLFGCSTAGEIAQTSVLDDSVVCTAVAFEKTRIATHQVALSTVHGSEAAGAALARGLEHDGLRHVLVLSDGLNVNGSELVRGLLSGLPAGVQVTGGLAGDGARFEKTQVVCGERLNDAVAVVGLYGESLNVGHGSMGGWDTFGPVRQVTRSEGNVLFELDGKPALELYKTYLGEHAEGLPSTGLLFPLNIRRAEGDDALVRTILAVDEETQSLTFAGDMPTGSLAQLMKANFDRLVEGAEGAARHSASSLSGQKAELAILISCVGRKLVLKQRTEEEVEGVAEMLGEQAVLTGFYSYGEIAPSAPNAGCDLHNQTMTITTFSES